MHARTSSISSLSSGRSKTGVGLGGDIGFSDRADAHLPRVASGEGEGPDVQYTKSKSVSYHPTQHERLKCQR